MKKLTAGIFATLLAVVSADSAYAAIASSGYVDEKVGEVSQTVTTLSGTVSGHTTQIGTINTNLDKKADKATTLSGYGITDAYTSAKGTALEGRVAAVEEPEAQVAAGVTGPVSGGTVYTAIQGVSGNVGTVTSDVADLKEDMTQAQTDISGLKEASATHATKTELAGKQDKLSQTGSASQPVYVNAEGKVTAGNTIPTVTTSITTGQTAAAQAGAVATALAAKANTADLGALATLDAVGSTQITDGAVATADIADKAVTEAKLSDTVNASLDKADSALQQADLADYVTKEAADAAYAGIATETTASTASTNAQTALSNIGTLSQLTTDAKGNTVAAINEVATEAAAAATAAAGAKTAADTAQGDVNALEAVVNHETTGLAAAHDAIDAVEGRVTTAEGEIDAIQTEMDTMATSETVTNLTNRVTTAEGDIDDLEAAVNNAESGLAATNAIADQALANAATAQSAAETAQATADAKQDKLTGTIGGSMQPVYLNNGTITAGATLGSLATKSTVTNADVADGALAQSKINGLATSLAAKLTTPPTSENGETGLYVLTYDGTDFQWEDIARTVAE